MEHNNSISKTAAWVEHIMSFHHKAKRANEPETNLMPTASGDHSESGMLLLAPANTSLSTRDPEQRETQANERAVAGGNESQRESLPQIDPEEVADRVYRLMRNDLILERERATK